jgi:hypothetical protein
MDTNNNYNYNYILSFMNKKSQLSLNNMTYKEYLLKKKKEKIKADIFSLINKKMESIERKMDNNNCDEISNNNSKSKNEVIFQDYFGERISTLQILEQENKNNSNDIYYKNEYNLNNYDLKYKKKIYNKYENLNLINLKKISDSKQKDTSVESLSETQTIINGSYFSDLCDTLELATINTNKKRSYNIIKNKLDYKNKNKLKKILIPKTPLKNSTNYNDNNNTNTLSKIFLKEVKPNYLYDSTSTCNTDTKNKNKNSELVNFFTEINLPLVYAIKFIENGFDDLNIILALTKTSTAITNKNLKEIGIKKASHRSQILIHLEERAGIIPFYVENKIYNNNENNGNDNKYELYKDKLFIFLSRIGCEVYLNNFKRNGYCNIELLLTQMSTRQSIDKTMLIEDLCIENENDINNIISNLLLESKKYIKGLKKNVIIENNMNQSSCETCLIF